MNDIKICKFGGKKKNIGQCYGGDCSNEQFYECYPELNEHCTKCGVKLN